MNACAQVSPGLQLAGLPLMPCALLSAAGFTLHLLPRKRCKSGLTEPPRGVMGMARPRGVGGGPAGGGRPVPPPMRLEVDCPDPELFVYPVAAACRHFNSLAQLLQDSVQPHTSE